MTPGPVASPHAAAHPDIILHCGRKCWASVPWDKSETTIIGCPLVAGCSKSEALPSRLVDRVTIKIKAPSLNQIHFTNNNYYFK